MAKIRVLICPSDGRAPYLSWISDTLKNLQNIVHGHIETVRLPVLCRRSVPLIICNESGRLLGMEPNPCSPIGELVGDLIICSAGAERFASLDPEDAHRLLVLCKQAWALHTGRLTPARYPTK